jgi:hypothetical protein
LPKRLTECDSTAARTETCTLNVPTIFINIRAFIIIIHLPVITSVGYMNDKNVLFTNTTIVRRIEVKKRKWFYPVLVHYEQHIMT